jgi:hypothetical protein
VVCIGFLQVGSNLLQARRVHTKEIGVQVGDEYEDMLRVVLMGASGVGKFDWILSRFTRTSLACSPN